MKRWIVIAVLAVLALPHAAQAAGDRILFVSNRADGARELYLVDRDGSNLERLTFNDIFETQPIWSPDRSRIAFAGRRAGVFDIYTIAADGSDLRQVTTGAAQENFPKWTADGRIVFMRGPLACPCRPWIVNADGSGLEELAIPGDVLTLEPSPRGQRLVYSVREGGVFSLHVTHLNGRGDRKITEGDDFNARWSPRGNTLVFLRSLSPTDNDVWVVQSDGSGARPLTATPDRVEFFPAWSSDGSEVLFSSGAGDLFAVSLADGSESALSTTPRAPFTETFDDGLRDSSLWHQISDPGGTIGERDGRLVASIAGTAVPGGIWNQVDQHWGSQCSLPGDFDYEVDWQLLTWPRHGGFFAQLSGFFGDASIARHSNPWDPPYDEQISAWRGGPDFVNAVINSTATSGSFRLVRVDGTIFAYERTTSVDWNLVFSAPGVSGATVFGMGLWAPGWSFAHQDGSVAYDNFQLSSGELSCPSWWVDLAPDVR